MSYTRIRKISLFFGFLVIFLSTCSAAAPQELQASPAPLSVTADATAVHETVAAFVAETVPTDPPVMTVTPTMVYLPTISKPADKFAGVYFKQYWNAKNVKKYMVEADQAAGKKHASTGWFIDLEDIAFTRPVTYLPGNNLFSQLEELWLGGYVSFVNIGTNATAGQINRGERDREIGYLADFYKAWVDQGGGRRAMLGPLQEMNGDWTAYGRASTPSEYQQAYRRIVNAFAQKGIRRDQVWWVFAPNGWHDPAYPWRAFENYYPGHDVVDLVGFSSYNYGWCPSTSSISGKWESYDTIFKPYIERMQVMAPTKPIIIAETATTAYWADKTSDIKQKDSWLIQNYEYLAGHPAVLGVYYFSFSEFDGYACDFELNPNGTYVSGYRQALQSPAYRYLTAQDLGWLIP